MKKTNNKGFSLVELIVVVLIMGILAVALTPQVIKWVNNSRIAADKDNYESLYSSLTLALADEGVYGEIKASGAAAKKTTLTMGGTGSSFDSSVSTPKLVAKMVAIAPNYTSIASKVSDGDDKKEYTIEVWTDGSVRKGTQPDDESDMDK